MFGVQPELADQPANVVRRGFCCRSARPAVRTAGVLELQAAAVSEVKRGLVIGRVDLVSQGLFSGIFSDIHALRLTKIPLRPSEKVEGKFPKTFGGKNMFIGLFLILLV